jgi:hypothetical protein
MKAKRRKKKLPRIFGGFLQEYDNNQRIKRKGFDLNESGSLEPLISMNPAALSPLSGKAAMEKLPGIFLVARRGFVGRVVV